MNSQEKQRVKQEKEQEKQRVKQEKEQEKQRVKQEKEQEKQRVKQEKEQSKQRVKQEKEQEKQRIKQEKEQAKELRPVNRGTGAGGSNTNVHGKKFEEDTDNESNLLLNGYERRNIISKHYCLCKKFEDRTIIFASQNRFKSIIKHQYGIDIFRQPDEAYIIEYANGKTEIKILEKKEQHCDGSVETKLWAGVALKREYQILFESLNIEISYGFCLNKYLMNLFNSNHKKYVILRQILSENDIQVFDGEESNYLEKLNSDYNLL